jgi:hypothetical protein
MSTAGRNAAFAFSTFRASGIRHQSACSLGFQPAVLFSQNKPATSNQPPVLFSQNKPAPAISHQPTEQAECLLATAYRQQPADRQKTQKKASDQLEKSVGGDRFSLALEVEKLVLLSSLLESWQPPLLL